MTDQAVAFTCLAAVSLVAVVWWAASVRGWRWFG